MKEVIERIVSTENEAKSIIEKARSEAEQIISEAKKQAQDIMENTKKEAIIETQHIIDSSTKKAEEEKQKKLTQKAKEIKDQFVINEDTKQKAIEWVIKTVCKIS